MTAERDSLLHAMLVLEDELEELRNVPLTPEVVEQFVSVRDVLNSLTLELQAMGTVNADE